MFEAKHPSRVARVSNNPAWHDVAINPLDCALFPPLPERPSQPSIHSTTPEHLTIPSQGNARSYYPKSHPEMRASLQRCLTGLLAAASLPSRGLAQNDELIDFPATGELTVVFPRNETYAVEAPFPVILGFYNAPVFMSYPTQVYWNIRCTYGTLHGTGYLDGERSVAPPSDPWFYINATDTLARVREGEEDGPPGSRRGQFQNWRFNDIDICTLEWELLYYTTCERLDDGSLLIKGGDFPKRKGNVTFTLEPGATRPRDAIENYEGCALAGTAVRIAQNHTGCADIGDDGAPKPKPCDLDVEGAASSLAAAVVTPTTSMTELPVTTTTTTASSSTGSGTTATDGSDSPNTTGDGSDEAEESAGTDGDGGSRAPGGVAATIVVVVAVAIGGVFAPFLL